MAFGRAKKARKPLEYMELLDYAVKSLGAKMKSERDLRRRLSDRVSPDETGRADVEKVIAKLKELGYLSDARFAADFARLRQENEKLGARRVQQGLMQKGVASSLVSEAVTKQYEDVDEVALARQYVERKRLSSRVGIGSSGRRRLRRSCGGWWRRGFRAGRCGRCCATGAGAISKRQMWKTAVKSE